MLPSAAAAWPTPKATKGGANTKRKERGAGGPDLQEMAQGWPTPKASDSKGADPARGENRTGSRHTGDGLATLVEVNWPTPVASDAKRETAGIRGESNPTLGSMARGWPTPSARDWKGSPDAPRSAGTGSTAERLDQLDRVAEHFPYSRRAETTLPDGLACLLGDRTLHPLSRLLLLVYRSVLLRRWLRLNPAFSEWLMGWPNGWTGFASSATEYHRWLRAWRSHLFGLNWSGDSE